MTRVVIVGGAQIKSYDFIKERLREDDFFIYCDGGLRHEKELGFEADLIVGDFDSHKRPDRDTEIIELPRRKDDTDTYFAVREAIRRGFKSFVLVGVIGGRLDHTLGNIYILLRLDEMNLKGEIIDDYSTMELVGEDFVYIESDVSYFSLINITGLAKNIDIENAEYSLENGEIKSSYQYGISNQVIGDYARVRVGLGRLLLIKIYRDSHKRL